MNYKKYNDNELVYMVLENDEDSSNILLKKYSPIINKISWEYYRKFTGYGYEFEDFYQEALAAFYRAIYIYNDSRETLFYSFVTLCIRRNLASFTRSLCSNKNKSIDCLDIDELDYCVEDVNENPFMKDSYKGLENIIREVLFSLPIEASSILELKLNGFTYKEISSLLDIPVSSVEFKSRRARNLLRNKVKNYYCK